MKVRYNDKKKYKKNNRIIVFMVVFVIVILLTLLSLLKINNNIKEDIGNKIYLSPDDFSNVREVLEYFGNEYIAEENHKDDEYPIIIKARFKQDLFTNEESNKFFYDTIINDIASVVKYKNFQVIDEHFNNTIKVTCNGSKITDININNDSYYYDTVITNKALKKYNDKDILKINSCSEIITQLISNNWYVSGINFGSKESRYDKYDIYFDEGFEIRVISGKVYNIIFTEKYAENVIDDIRTGMNNDAIQNKLGKPMFNGGLGILGYKTDNFYIFFYNKEISVYRVEKNYDTSEFIKLINTYNNNYDLRELGNDLTYIWDDYDEYNYDKNYVELTYSLKGVKIQFNYGTPNGFLLFNNYTGLVNDDIYIFEAESKEQLLENMHYEDYDLVCIAENLRCHKDNLKYTPDLGTEGEALEDYKRSFRVDYKIANDGKYTNLQFISMLKDYPDSQLDENLVVDEYEWINDYLFQYKIDDIVYEYNCITRENRKI